MNEIPYHKLAVAVMAVNQDDKVLLVKSHQRGWEFPGGFVGDGESIEETAVREVKEESGIGIQLTNFLGIEHDAAGSTLVILLKGEPVSGSFSSSDETQDVGYFTIDDAQNIIALELYKERLTRCLDDKEIPFIFEKKTYENSAD